MSRADRRWAPLCLRKVRRRSSDNEVRRRRRSRRPEDIVTEAVIVAATRTPIGRAHKGTLVDVDAFTLAQIVVESAVARSGIDSAFIDDIVLAESLQGGGVIARNVAVRLGLTSVPGLADNRHCAAGLSAIQIAAGSIRAGMDRVVIAGGTESLSSIPRVFKAVPVSSGDYQPWFSPTHPPTPEAPNRDMSITVGENTARMAGVDAARSRHVGVPLEPAGRRSARQGAVRLRDRPGARHQGRRHHGAVRSRRAAAGRHHHGKASVARRHPSRASERDGHRRQCVGHQRRCRCGRA